MTNKKALSNVVVSVLLILLAAAAIVVVWQVIKTQINKTQLSPDFCLNSEITIKSACYTSSQVEIKLLRIPEKQITDLDFALNYADKSDVYSCSSSCSNCIILDSGTKTYYITVAKPDSLTLKYGNCLENKKVGDC